MRPRHLYVHVPFCARRRIGGAAAVQATRRPPVRRWLGALEAELRRVAAAGAWAAPAPLDTVYVGGGEVSVLGAGAMAELRRRLEPYVAWDDASVEWTVESGPEGVDAELASVWRAAGVSRVTLAARSFDEPTLRWLGGSPGPDGAERAVDAARSAGIDDIDIELVFGLPERLERSWEADVERALDLAPSHVSLYGLTVEPGTPLAQRVREGRDRLPDDDVYAREYLWAAERLAAAGFRHYEVSHLARPGRESRHNRAHWSGAAYLGIGPSAHSFLPPVRRWNLSEWPAYRSAVEEGRRPVEGRERVEGAAARLERIWLALRTASGLDAGALDAGQTALVQRWRERGWADEADDAVRLTPRGWLLLDRLVLELDDAVDGDDRLDGASEEATHSLQQVT